MSHKTRLAKGISRIIAQIQYRKEIRFQTKVMNNPKLRKLALDTLRDSVANEIRPDVQKQEKATLSAKMAKEPSPEIIEKACEMLLKTPELYHVVINQMTTEALKRPDFSEIISEKAIQRNKEQAEREKKEAEANKNLETDTNFQAVLQFIRSVDTVEITSYGASVHKKYTKDIGTDTPLKEEKVFDIRLDKFCQYDDKVSGLLQPQVSISEWNGEGHIFAIPTTPYGIQQIQQTLNDRIIELEKERRSKMSKIIEKYTQNTL